MKETIQLLTIASLAVVAAQDFRKRMISWYWIPALFLLFACSALQHISLTEAAFNLTVNLMFTVVQLSMITLYFSMKEKKFVNIIDTWLGMGDVLLLLVLCVAFSPVNFILFYMCSLVITIAGYAVYKMIMRGRSSTIPLAGAVALALLLCLCYQLLTRQLSFYDDSPALRLIMH